VLIPGSSVLVGAGPRRARDGHVAGTAERSTGVQRKWRVCPAADGRAAEV